MSARVPIAVPASDPLRWLADVDPNARAKLFGVLDAYILEDNLQDYRPYRKQALFHAAGRTHRNRLLRAGNQVGKTFPAAAEVAMHLTGEYPPWWIGHRFVRPNTWWATGETATSVRDVGQARLIGEPNRWGTGWIPERCLTSMYGRSKAVGNLLDYIRIKHVTGGTSMLRFRFYEQTRESWQGPPVDGVWWDEEPPDDKYAEGMARTIATGGITMLSYTPIKGRTEITRRYIDADIRPPSYHDTLMTINDAEHITKEGVEIEKARWPEHEHGARLYGIPMQGSGQIYPILESDIVCDAFEVPDWWPRLGALDFGWDHPTAGVLACYDRDTDIVYITKEYREKKKTALINALALKGWGDHLSWAWPHDGYNTEKGTGVQLADAYRTAGLKMLPTHAQFKKGFGNTTDQSKASKISVERGINDILTRLETGKLKIFKDCRRWLDERRLYHRKDNKIVKKEDDLMDATRTAIMALRFANVPGPSRPLKRPPPNWQAM